MSLPRRYNYLNGASKPAWLVAAMAELGVREVSGPKSNERILLYRKLAKTAFGGDDGAVPWCAIFVNAMLEKTGVAGSLSGMARSYVKHPKFERLDRALIGAVAVKSSNRGPASGHVGFYVGQAGGLIYLLGGNQNDSVSIASFAAHEFVGFYWPAGRAKPGAPWDKPYTLPRADTAIVVSEA